MVDTLCSVNGTRKPCHIINWAESIVRGRPTFRITLQKKVHNKVRIEDDMVRLVDAHLDKFVKYLMLWRKSLVLVTTEGSRARDFANDIYWVTRERHTEVRNTWLKFLSIAEEF